MGDSHSPNSSRKFGPITNHTMNELLHQAESALHEARSENQDTIDICAQEAIDQLVKCLGRIIEHLKVNSIE